MPAALIAPSLTLRVPPAASGFRPSDEASAYGRSEELSRSHRQVRPFVGWSGRLVWPLLTPLPPSHHLTMAVAQRQVKRSPRVRRATFIPYTRRIYFSIFPGDYRALGLLAPSPRWSCLLCASCSSGRDFAHRFLQIPPHGGHPCGSANDSHHQGS